MSTHVLENERLRATIADAGAELISVYDKKRQTERIWTGEASVWNRHAPILFPFVGKVTEGKTVRASIAHALVASSLSA